MSQPDGPSASIDADPLERICVVLVEPQDDINIGTTVRALKNFQILDLRLVRPRSADPERVRISAPKADDYIAEIAYFETLDEALADCHFVIGTSARTRSDKTLTSEPRGGAARAIAEARQSRRVAYLFGREDSGLPNDAIDRCHLVVHIPTNPDYTSLNLGQAVLLNAWELFRIARDTPVEAPTLGSARGDFQPAPIEAIDRMLDQAERSLDTIEFFKTGSTRHIMRTLRHVFQRAALDTREVAIFHGIFSEIIGYLRRTRPSDDHS
jgi:TrmH family RNA methyltransferase